MISSLDDGSTLKVAGDVINSRIRLEGARLNITGTLTNEGGGQLYLLGPNDLVTISNGLTNFGAVDLKNGSTLQVKGSATNSGTLEANNFGNGGGSTLTLKGLLTNTATGIINLNGPGDILHAATGLANNGLVNVNNGLSIVSPFVNNGGAIKVDSTSTLVVGKSAPLGGRGYTQRANGTLGEIITPTGFG